MICENCDSPATRLAFYGDEDTVVGGGQARIYLCDKCMAPCHHHGDPHAGFSHIVELSPFELAALEECHRFNLVITEDDEVAFGPAKKTSS